MATSPAPDAAAPPGMCPGIAVLGGGGAGGDGDGDGNGGKDGSGGDGNGNGDGAGGDGKGSGKCGDGSSGGCTNCGHNVAAGDPVDVVTGNVFTIPKTDMVLPGTFTFAFQRSYSMSRRHVDIGMGPGWTHTLGWTLEEHGRELVLRAGDGRVVNLPHIPEAGDVYQNGAWRVMRGTDFYAVLPGNEFQHFFAKTPDGYRLDLVRYRERGCIRLAYDNGRLATVIDTVGRRIVVRHDERGRIRSLSAPDPRGNTIVFAQYSYDEHGDLSEVTDADGHTTRYRYDDDHRLTRLEYPTGLVYEYVYDAHDRCVETWGHYPGRVDPALAPGLPPLLADGSTRAKGIHHCRLTFSSDGSYSEVVNSAGLRRYELGPRNTVAKAVNALGGVVTRAYDDRGRVTASVDAIGGTWQYVYDGLNKIVRETDPEGNAVTVVRDLVGNEVLVTDPAGGVTTLGRDASGEITWVRDAAGAVLQIRLDATGQALEAIDARGGRHTYERDAHANCIARTYPNGARYQFEYDWWGRMTREIDPLGAITTFTYNNRGDMTSVRDPAGRVTSWTYDGMGYVIADVEPDGSVRRHEYGGLQWPYLVTHADGTQIRAAYSRDGWVEFFENERGERHTFEHNGEGQITRETSFHGQDARFGRDLAGRLISFDDGSGKTERELSPVGRLLKEEAADGSTRSYAYDRRGELISAFEGTNGFEWTRDATGHILREVLHIEGRRYALDSQVTPAGDRVGYKTSLGLEVHVARDTMGDVTALDANGEALLRVARDPLGRPIREELSNGGTVVREWDAVRRLSRVEVIASGAAAGDPGEPAWVGRQRGTWSEFDYTPVDEVLKVTTSEGDDVEYEYDVRRHLKRAKRGADVEELAVDAAGNYFERGPGAPQRVYETGNVLRRRGDTEYEYDVRGFLVAKHRDLAQDRPPETTTYTWSPWGKLERVELPDGSRVEYSYDPFARLLARRRVRGRELLSRHDYVWDRTSMVHDVELSGEAPAVQTFLFDDDGFPLGQRSAQGWLFCVNDPKGTTDRLVDGRGQVVRRLERATFGRVTGAPETPFRFPGQVDDPETGLHYNRYRFYDPAAGRYIAPDPIGLDGGFNLYAYCPNPIGWTDPMGWDHQMTVVAPPGFGATNSASSSGTDSTYGSGYGEGKNCPADLANQANAHTEQKFARDLQNSGTQFAGKDFTLTGRLPPCPTCHNALRQAAASSGANVTYQWQDPKGTMNNIQYNGSSAPTFSGAQAQALQNANYNNWQSNPARTWDYSAGPGATAAYRQQAGAIPPGGY